MEYKDILEHCKRQMVFLEQLPGAGLSENGKKVYDEHKMVADLIEKHVVGKKPLTDSGIVKSKLCPNCYEILDVRIIYPYTNQPKRIKPKFCRQCGCKIDWNETWENKVIE